MKFSVFSDLHYCPGIFMGGTEEDLHFIQHRAEKENCSFIIHAGDFCHGPSSCTEYLSIYNNFHIPSYHCLGNHDTDETSYSETLRLYNMPDGHYFFDCGGYRFIICDPNFYLLDGEYIHYDLGNYYQYGGSRDYMPPDQLIWLSETIAGSEYPCVIISHESFERMDGVKNRDEVQKIIKNANIKRPHSVLMCINGHYHCDFIRILDNVIYFDLNSASFNYINISHDKYTEELSRKYAGIRNTLVYNDPVHAMITLEGNSVTINGMESTMLMGVRREDTDNPAYDDANRAIEPKVQSAKIVLG